MSKSLSLAQALQKVVEHDLDYGGTKIRAMLLEQSSNRGKASVCVLFSGADFSSAKILLTERALSVATHPGQVAFPGGSDEPRDQGDPAVTALRECEEEVGIPRALPKVIGLLPPFPTLTGNFEVRPVIAVLDHSDVPLMFADGEVKTSEWVSVQDLRQTRRYETRSISGVTLTNPYFMWGERKMWGLTAWIFDLILNRYDTIEK